MRFRDRLDAAAQLARRLSKYHGMPGAVVAAIPRGGVVVGRELARRLGLDFDIILAKKIGHPKSPEYAIGVVNLVSELIDEDIVARDGISRAYIESETARIRMELRKRYNLYRGNVRPAPLADRVVIISDDGIATGNTMTAAVRAARREGAAKIIAAAPVCSQDAAAALRGIADEVVCVVEPEELFAIGNFYGDFDQVTDDEVVRLLGTASLPSFNVESGSG
ncbi:MAG TPA: phosphoribosyltransferase family protein [Elusimicrobiota bacterium]|nr:phosphoribosyltransferase family protein [Elusimicrobiota bacterium]